MKNIWKRSKKEVLVVYSLKKLSLYFKILNSDWTVVDSWNSIFGKNVIWVNSHCCPGEFQLSMGEISSVVEWYSPLLTLGQSFGLPRSLFSSSFSWFKNHLYLEETKTSSISIYRLSQCTSISRGAGHSVGACEGSKTSWIDIYLIEHWTFYSSIQNYSLSYSRILGLNTMLIVLFLLNYWFFHKKSSKSYEFLACLSVYLSQYA